MATTIKLKNSVTTTAAPSSLAQGEVATNVTDKKLWVGNAASSPVQILGAGATVSGTDVTYTGTLTGGTGVVNLGSGQFYKDASGNVGIGTSSPTSKLHVSGSTTTVIKSQVTSSAGNVARFELVSPVSDYAWYVADNQNAVVLYDYNAGAERMRIDSSGNVGIGASSPTQKLQVTGTDNTGLIGLKAQNNNGGLGIAGIEFASDGTYTKAAIGLLRQSVNGRGRLVFYNDASDDAANWSTADEKMCISEAGNVGIGTSSPSEKLSVNGGITSIGDSVLPSGVSGVTIGYDTANLIGNIYSLSSGVAWRDLAIRSNQTVFFGAGTERMRIDSSGNLGVGTTPSATPASGFTGMINSGSSYFNIGHVNGTGSGTGYIQFLYNSGLIGSIAQSGTTSVAYNTSSDYRLKENIAPMQGALDVVAQLKPVTYNWKADGSNGQGFIAHELQAVVPDCVTGEKDATRIEQYEITPAIQATFDEEGNELTPAVEAVMGEREVPVYQGIDTSFLVATLTASIQELKAIVDAQSERIAVLEAK